MAHASTTALRAIDGVLRKFLQSTCISEIEALVQFHLAPLAVRRDIALLGVIHRCALGMAPPSFPLLLRDICSRLLLERLVVTTTISVIRAHCARLTMRCILLWEQ